MSKVLSGFGTKAKALKNAPSKFTAAAVEGSRLIPSKTKDADFQVRVDAGHYDPETKLLNVVLQVNGEAKSPGLVEWRNKNSSHGKLATASFDTAASNQKAEFERVVDVLSEEARRNVG